MSKTTRGVLQCYVKATNEIFNSQCARWKRARHNESKILPGDEAEVSPRLPWDDTGSQ